jgi:hypothetical protein
MLKNAIVTIATYSYWLVGLAYVARAIIHLDPADLLVAAVYWTMAYTLKKDAHMPIVTKEPEGDGDTPSAQ